MLRQMYLHPYRQLLLSLFMAVQPRTERQLSDQRQLSVLCHNPPLAQHQHLGNKAHLVQLFLMAVRLASLAQAALLHLVAEMLSGKSKCLHPVSQHSLHLGRHQVNPQNLHSDPLLHSDSYRNRHLERLRHLLAHRSQ